MTRKQARVILHNIPEPVAKCARGLWRCNECQARRQLRAQAEAVLRDNPHEEES